MEATSFETWLGAITALTGTQRRRAFEALASAEAGVTAETPREGTGAPERTGPARSGFIAAPVTPTVTDLGQRKAALTGCPHCGQTEIVRWGTSSGLPRHRCKACARTFNALTKTPLARLRMRQKWTTQADALIDGVGIAEAASRCGVHYATAFPPKPLRDLRLAAPVPCGAVRRQAEGLERDRRER